MNPNDKIRAEILQWFYERNSAATSQYGKKGSAAKISDAKAGLKATYGHTQQLVMSNLTYLIDKGWINKSEIEKTVRVRGGTVPSTTVWYEISSAGIDKIEGASEFQQNNRYAGINISATGTNVITMGDGNVVNAQFTQLHEQLDQLKQSLITSSAIGDKEKLDVAADIESIKDQLAKSTPNTGVIAQLWKQIDHVASIGGVVGLAQTIVPLIAAAVGHPIS